MPSTGCCLQDCGLIALGVVALGYLTWRVSQRWLNPPRRYDSVPSRHVLVTGASSGIGADCALTLAKRGFVVHAGVRKEKDGAALVEGFEAVPESEKRGFGKGAGGEKGSIVPVIIDVADDASVEKGVGEVGRRCGDEGLGALVNNAGVLVAGPLEFLPLAKVRQQFDINVIGQVAVTQAALPFIRRAGRGARIVFVSSLAGKLTVPFNGAYAASKHAIESVADAFRRELGAWGISVSILEPGYVETKILSSSDEQSKTPLSDLPKDWAHFYGVYNKNPPKRSSKAVAKLHVTSDAFVDAITNSHPLTRYVVGTKGLVNQFWWGTRMPDRLVDATFAKKAWPGRYRKDIPAK